MNYPLELEAFWIREARAVWGPLPEARLIERSRLRVQELSDRFTIDRRRAPEPYGDDPESRAAYGLFFFPQTFARTQLVLRECGWPSPGNAPLRVLDLGAGTGAACFAALAMLGARPSRLRAVDRSAGALQTLARLAAEQRALWPGAEVEPDQADLTDRSDSSEPFDLILCSFALNEVAERDPAFDATAWVRRLLDGLAPNGLLALIEPALKSSAERLIAMRDALAASRAASIIGPCPHHAPCPMRAEGRFWCHEVRRWAPPPIAEKINRLLFRDLPNLKFSFLALKKEAPPRDEFRNLNRGRLVAPLTPQRGKFVTRICFADGTLRDVELLARDTDAATRMRLRHCERGSRVLVDPDRELGDGTLRIREFREIRSS